MEIKKYNNIFVVFVYLVVTWSNAFLRKRSQAACGHKDWFARQPDTYCSTQRTRASLDHVRRGRDDFFLFLAWNIFLMSASHARSPTLILLSFLFFSVFCRASDLLERSERNTMNAAPCVTSMWARSLKPPQSPPCPEAWCDCKRYAGCCDAPRCPDCFLAFFIFFLSLSLSLCLYFISNKQHTHAHSLPSCLPVLSLDIISRGFYPSPSTILYISLCIDWNVAYWIIRTPKLFFLLSCEAPNVSAVLGNPCHVVLFHYHYYYKCSKWGYCKEESIQIGARFSIRGQMVYGSILSLSLTAYMT